MTELPIETPAGLIGMIGLAVQTKLAAMMELTGMLVQSFGLMIGMLAATPEVLADLTGIIGLMAGMPIAAQRLAEMAEMAELALARQAELPRCTALAGWSELVAETGLDAGFALVLVTPTELIESTETLEILVALTAQAEPLAEMLESVELLELAALLIEPVGPVGLAVLMAETPTELMVGLAGMVGHPYSRR